MEDSAPTPTNREPLHCECHSNPAHDGECEGCYSFALMNIIANDICENLNLEAFKAFTWSPNPNLYRSNDPIAQYRTCLRWLYAANPDSCLKHFVFTPELTQNGNIHLHGYFFIKDPIKFYRRFLPMLKSKGNTYIKDRVDDNWLYEYMTKSVVLMANLMADEDVPIPLYDDNYFDYHLKYFMSPRNTIKHTFLKNVRITYDFNQKKRK